MAQVRQQGSKNIATKSVTTNRWFIWTIVGVVVILLGTAAYIAIASDNDASANVQAIFLVHHPKPATPQTKGGVATPAKK